MAPNTNEYGILSVDELPDASWQERWDGIEVPEGVKDRILNYALFVLSKREEVSQVGLPIHGLLLFEGPPGTGKTTLARGLAHMAAAELAGRVDGSLGYCEVDAYRLASGLLGESQKHVERLFFRSIPNLAKTYDRLVVLLDEVENIAVSRANASLDANPVDVHRATNAFLTGLDYVSQNHRNVLLLATTNFPDGLDNAFVSRVDVVQPMGLPDPDVIARIVMDTLEEFGHSGTADPASLDRLRTVMDGVDGRQARKQVLEAVIASRELSLAPADITVDDVVRSLQRRAGATA